MNRQNQPFAPSTEDADALEPNQPYLAESLTDATDDNERVQKPSLDDIFQPEEPEFDELFGDVVAQGDASFEDRANYMADDPTAQLPDLEDEQLLEEAAEGDLYIPELDDPQDDGDFPELDFSSLDGDSDEGLPEPVIASEEVDTIEALSIQNREQMVDDLESTQDDDDQDLPDEPTDTLPVRGKKRLFSAIPSLPSTDELNRATLDAENQADETPTYKPLSQQSGIDTEVDEPFADDLEAETIPYRESDDETLAEAVSILDDDFSAEDELSDADLATISLLDDMSSDDLDEATEDDAPLEPAFELDVDNDGISDDLEEDSEALDDLELDLMSELELEEIDDEPETANEALDELELLDELALEDNDEPETAQAFALDAPSGFDDYDDEEIGEATAILSDTFDDEEDDTVRLSSAELETVRLLNEMTADDIEEEVFPIDDEEFEDLEI